MSRRAAGGAPTGSRSSLNQHEMVLLAMAHASDWSTRKLPYEDLVLQTWRDFPAEFSLRNHPEHPDASDIHKRLYQTLKPNGLAVSLGNKVFRLTEKGVDAARRLEDQITGTTTEEPARERLARDEQALLSDAMSSRAYTTWRAGDKAALIDYDARMFFQFGTGTSMGDRRLRVDFAEKTFDKAARLGVPEARKLVELSAYLRDKFRRLVGEEHDAN